MEIAREALANALIFLLLVLGAVIVDGALHFFGLPQWGRYLGYWGTLLIVISFGYSARKRNMITTGRPTIYLRVHEFLAWTGAMLVLVHGGIHFNALLPWLALAAMVVAVASGLTGKFLLRKSKIMIRDKKRDLLEQGLTPAELEDRLYWESVFVSLMQNWRAVHLPVTVTFIFLAALHIVTVLIFWRW